MTRNSVADDRPTRVQGRLAQVLPEGMFWKKYSPHHELPLSFSSSLFLHILGFVLLGGFLLVLFGLKPEEELKVDTIIVTGVGGGPNSVGGNRGASLLPSEEAVDAKDKRQPDRVAENIHKEQLAKPEAKKPELPPLSSNSLRPVDDTSAANAKLGAIGNQLHAKLAGAIVGNGLGGTGSGGDAGSGTGTRKSNAMGPGQGNLTQREKRLLRWVMKFNTRSGEDYVDQLIALGGILAIPASRNQHYRVIRNLRQRPVQAQQEDLKDLNRIYWVDDKPQSVSVLALALGIRPVPEHIVAFFPPELEKELAEKEQRFAGNKEEDIAETVFQVRRIGKGYEPVVVQQRRR